MTDPPAQTSLRDLLDVPDGRLSVAELARVAEAIAARPEVWRPLSRQDGEDRHYESLYVDDHLGVWVISWMPGHDTGFHDHAGSAGAVAVAEGEIREERPVWGEVPRRVDAREADGLSFDETEIHRMVNASDRPAVTIHAYSPPLERMGVYVAEEDGYLRRRSVGWDHPLGS